jgi:hypothetical protein
MMEKPVLFGEAWARHPTQSMFTVSTRSDAPQGGEVAPAGVDSDR